MIKQSGGDEWDEAELVQISGEKFRVYQRDGVRVYVPRISTVAQAVEFAYQNTGIGPITYERGWGSNIVGKYFGQFGKTDPSLLIRISFNVSELPEEVRVPLLEYHWGP